MQLDNSHAKTICGAKTRSGKPCKNPPIVGGNGRCRMHNGNAKKGMELPQFKHGRYSKYMPTELLKVYNEAIDDPQLLSVRAEIALMDALLTNLLPNLDTGESGKAWKDILTLIARAREAVDNKDTGKFLGSMRDIESIAQRRVLHYETQSEIKHTVDARRKLVETETKISMQNERAIPVEQMMVLMSQVIGVIQSVVTEEKQRYAIAVELQRLVSLPSGSTSTD